MPAPGDQPQNSGDRLIANPFDDVKPRISEYTAQEIATLQSRLEKQLGPEYISSRIGPAGQKVHYIAAEKCIQLANEIFGFNGWSSSIQNLQVDYVDENPSTLKVSLGLSVIVRVTLRDGTFHEDIGYGHIENCKGKGAAFEKAKKEGSTDGLKRALKNFGNVLGNCIYDKVYLSKITKVKVAPKKWDINGLHRHSDYILTDKKEADIPRQIVGKDTIPTPINDCSGDDEFGEFDDADFNDSHDPDLHPDEVTLQANPRTSNITRENANAATAAASVNHSNPGGASMSRIQNMPAPNRPNGAHQPQTPNNGTARSSSANGRHYNLQPIQGRVLNQPSRAGLSTPPILPLVPVDAPISSTTTGDQSNKGSDLQPQSGFVSAKAAGLLVDRNNSEATPQTVPPGVHAFNPHAKSPSIRKTPGIDHNVSKPLNKQLKQVPGAHQGSDGSTSPLRTNIVNPQLDATRRIGAPGSPGPMSNRGMYKPVAMANKREREESVARSRSPLADVPTNGLMANGDNGDIKRQRLDE